MAQYRFQEEYLEHLRDQDRRLREERHDYNNDPYFYTAPIYRYNRGGSYYEINQYGADTLRQAVNYGYQEGFRAGQADRQDNWRPDYNQSYAYQDATYGYNGYYVDPEDYRYYFRQGFQRGYEERLQRTVPVWILLKWVVRSLGQRAVADPQPAVATLRGNPAKGRFGEDHRYSTPDLHDSSPS